MAFYTSRVDDKGNEIERRLSARSSASTMPSGKTRLLSAGSEDHSCRNENKIRYVNSAAFIERNSTDRCGSCIEDNLDFLNIAETQSNNSNIVPPLDLQSEDSFPSHRDYTFSYRKHVVSANKIDPEDAYKTWLSAKRKMKSDEAAMRKRNEDEKRKEQEERREKAKEEYQRWLEKKAARKEAERAEAEMQALKQVKLKRTSPVTTDNESNNLSEQEAQARLIQWEQQKRVQEEKRRVLKRQQEEQQRQQEEQRRRMAAEAWDRWAAGASKKPKPVPLSRGFFTLRGTISDIYVNPNEWQNIVPEEKSN